jgi:molecular chaperone DnaK (HSP70)
MRLAIDFGTTNSVVAAWRNGAVIEAENGPPNPDAIEILALPGLSERPDPPSNGQPALIPSLLYVLDGDQGRTAAGQAVREQGLDQRADNRLFRNFKRGIAVTSDVSPAAPRRIDGARWGDRDAGRTFFQHILDALPYTTDEIEQLVLTAPVAAFEDYLGWLSGTMDAIAPDLPSVRLVDEATAAALGYAVTEPGAVVLVFDFGGGTLGLSLVQLPESNENTGGFLGRFRSPRQQAARVIAKAGKVLGGSDIDQWLLAEVLDRTGLTRESLGSDYAALLTRCEEAKIALSSADHTSLEFAAGDEAFSLTITRAELEAALESNQFYTALRHMVDKVMHIARQQGVFREDVDAVLLVGGSSLIPAVEATLAAYFRHTPILMHKPFTAVVEGALLLASGYGLDDYLIHSYGLRYLDETSGEHAYDEIIPAGARYPSEYPVGVVLSTAHADQAEIEFVIGEISTDSVALVEVQYEDGQAVFVAQADESQQQIRALNANTPLVIPLHGQSDPGEDRVKAAFTIDADRNLRVTATDLRTRKRLARDQVVAALR